MDRVLDSDEGHMVLRLPYRAPYDWPALIDFLKPRAIPGVEEVSLEVYRRTIDQGTVEVMPSTRENGLLLRVPVAAGRNLAGLVERARSLFDVGADPDAIERHLKTDPLLAKRIRPGLRVPGAWDPFELAVRAVLGQQVTVKAATTLAGRVNEAFGLSPAALAEADLTSVGLTRKRAEAIRGLAVAARCLDDPVTAQERLLEIPGIGPWTVQYIAMRALKEPDAFPASDLGLRKALSMTARQLGKVAEKWRPWRAYAAMHLWMGS
jgi:AraC family transcriptional regulator of adaptative response / DNA-3-methyladenine glycosylase II